MEELNQVVEWLKKTRSGNKTVRKALAEIERLQAIEAAAQEYMNSSSFIAYQATGACVNCESESDDPERHAENCSYRIHGTKLAALLERK